MLKYTISPLLVEYEVALAWSCVGMCVPQLVVLNSKDVNLYELDV